MSGKTGAGSLTQRATAIADLAYNRQALVGYTKRELTAAKGHSSEN